MFICCHPALAQHAQVALILKNICGLSTSKIATAYLISETTVAQRLVRAKRKIKVAGIPFVTPEKSLWHKRLDAVLKTIYLIFNEGYHSDSQSEIDTVLCDEATRLARTLAALTPNEPEVFGLMVLMYFHMSRFDSRIDKNNETITLIDQDRSKWNQKFIINADTLLKAALNKSKVGPFQIQAAISGGHAHAESFEHTDWKQIYHLYQKLFDYQASPIVKLNGAVALSFAKNVQAGLKELKAIEHEKVLKNYQPFWAAKADLLAKNGQTDAAGKAFNKAIALTNNKADLNYLNKQLERLHN